MVTKKIVSGLFYSILIIGIAFYYIAEIQSSRIKKQPIKQETIKTKQLKPEAVEKKYDLYSNTPYDLPLLSIYEISKLPIQTKKIIDEILEASQGFYILKKVNDKVLILLQNPILESNTFSRHDLQYVEIYPDGKKVFHNAGYSGIEGEISPLDKNKNNDWTFDKTVEFIRPIKHISRNEKGKIRFIEYWNYDPKEQIRYQMKDSKGKTISILKETQESDSNYRKEHIFYDNDGNITMSITINYDGADISRFTYYNSHHTVDSISIISEYENGLKIKESSYNESYELINTFLPKYLDGTRKSIQILNSGGEEIAKISS